jgi:hypothetical protein
MGREFNERDWMLIKEALELASSEENLGSCRYLSVLAKVETRTPAECTCTCINTSFGENPEGHDVGCPRWGTPLPNKHMPR